VYRQIKVTKKEFIMVAKDLLTLREIKIAELIAKVRIF